MHVSLVLVDVVVRGASGPHYIQCDIHIQDLRLEIVAALGRGSRRTGQEREAGRGDICACRDYYISTFKMIKYTRRKAGENCGDMERTDIFAFRHGIRESVNVFGSQMPPRK